MAMPEKAQGRARKRINPQDRQGHECDHAPHYLPCGLFMPTMMFNKTVRPSVACMTAVILLCGGCSQAPSVSILGAFFPGWMICALLGIALAVLLRALGIGRSEARRGGSPLLYPSLALLLGTLSWIVLFWGGMR
jgi:hypothetical protein